MKPYRVALAYKNFAACKGISHIGLGVSAINTAKVLRSNGIPCEVWPINTAQDLVARIERSRQEMALGLPHLTHVVLSAPWVATADWQRIILNYHNVEFGVNCHSNVGFLQADPNGVKLFREGLQLEQGNHNFHMAGNSKKFCQWVTDTYDDPCAWLPNLYFLDHTANPHRPPFRGHVLRIASFGATRPLKNCISAAAAALELAQQLRVDLELYISSGRNEGSSSVTVVNAIKEMYARVPYATLVENNWQSWPEFRKTVRHMHLMIQTSYTESFNMVTADGIAEGVTSVVSEAIDWVPPDWQANMDDVFDIAKVARRLLIDAHAPVEGLQYLEQHNAQGLQAWLNYFSTTGVQS